MQLSYNGTIGANYSHNLSTKEIAKIVRAHIKKNWKDCKASVTSDYNKICVALMGAPFSPFKKVSELPENMKRRQAEGYAQINHYRLDIGDEWMSAKGLAFFKDVIQFLQSYNYKDSDVQSDYLSCNFYIHMSIGKWDKAFIQTN